MGKELIVITKTADGLFRVGPTEPPGVPLDYSETETFSVSGPHSLIEGQWLAPKTDRETWIEQNKKCGFTFESQGTKRNDPIDDLANAVRPGESYNLEQLAAILKKSTSDIRRYWDNWHSGDKPRLGSRLEGSSGRVSSAFEVLEFVYHYAR